MCPAGGGAGPAGGGQAGAGGGAAPAAGGGAHAEVGSPRRRGEVGTVVVCVADSGEWKK